jgi:hypothetical protein
MNFSNNLRLDVTNSKDEEGNPVGVASNNGKNNQKW